MNEQRKTVERITLRQLVRYFALCDDERIQIVFNEDDWGDFVEVQTYSKLIQPYMGCEITDLGVEKSVHGNNYVIRAVIRVPEDYDEAPIEVGNGSVLR